MGIYCIILKCFSPWFLKPFFRDTLDICYNADAGLSFELLNQNLWGSHSETWIVNKLPINADILEPVHFSSVQSISHVWFFATPWIEAHQASLSITNLRSLLKYMAIELVMPSNHLILCHPLPLPPSFFSSIRVFSNESVLHSRWPKYWSFSISPSSENI